jgi:ectoine hydroxylase-related dioxygenase (phytanoyl-CoA dioxygenase family)
MLAYRIDSPGFTPDDVRAYRADGYRFPLRTISEETARGYLTQFERFEAAGHTREKNPRLMFKPHLCFMWMFELATNPIVLDAVEALIGPNILLYGSQAWNKLPDDPRFISWHRDSAYFGLAPNDLVTAWTALTEAVPENGGMRYLPQSHTWPDVDHVETFDKANLLSRGQTLATVDDSGAIDVVLRPGETSFHHERTAHSSGGNSTTARRLGFTGLYIATSVESTIGRRGALLVRGEDKYGHWDEDPVPRFDLDPAGVAASALATVQYTAGTATKNKAGA